MQQEAKHIADELEEIGLQILTHCEELPEYILHWPPPFPAGHSLFTLAVEAITIIEEWVLLPIGGTRFSTPPCLRKPGIETLVHLRAGYGQRLQEVHRLLDVLPDSILDCYVKHHTLPAGRRKTVHDNAVLIRSCLLHALVQTSIIAGRMQTIRQLFLAGERTLEELTECVYTDDFTQNV